MISRVALLGCPTQCHLGDGSSSVGGSVVVVVLLSFGIFSTGKGGHQRERERERERESNTTFGIILEFTSIIDEGSISFSK